MSAIRRLDADDLDLGSVPQAPPSGLLQPVELEAVLNAIEAHYVETAVARTTSQRRILYDRSPTNKQRVSANVLNGTIRRLQRPIMFGPGNRKSQRRQPHRPRGIESRGCFLNFFRSQLNAPVLCAGQL